MSVPKEKTQNGNKEDKRKRAKIGGIISIFILLMVGILIDLYFVPSGYYWKSVKNLGTICNTILGVQGTVITLTIAMLALISPKISGSYMGISKAKFYMDIQPILFSQNIFLLFY